jgi:hypothetical protein
VYWVGSFLGTQGLFEHSVTDGNVLTHIVPSTGFNQVGITADRKFVLLGGWGGQTVPITIVDTYAKSQVDSGDHGVTRVTVCDDGKIVTAHWTADVVVSYDISTTGQLTELHTADVGPIDTIVCSPGSGFVVAAPASVQELRSFAISPSLDDVMIDSVALTSNTRALAFNPTSADLFVLQSDGKLSVYAFNSDTGVFGPLRASVNTGYALYRFAHFDAMQFAYSKLFVHAADQLLVYDATLNLLSSETIISGDKTAICISEGVLCC